ncbi:Importin subunit alpha-1 [Bonamia ostreae]|uniref:Importin subunit alpha-1 n=1 Tax=Bonamia ostreae TaxID=126728 RepID=A0ABV2AKT6_9EUKA
MSNKDVRTSTVALEGIFNLLRNGENIFTKENSPNLWANAVEEAGGLDKLENLQTSENPSICLKAGSIVERFYVGDDGVDELEPAVKEDAFSFGEVNSGGGDLI